MCFGGGGGGGGGGGFGVSIFLGREVCRGGGVRGRVHVGKVGCQYTRFFSSQDIDVPSKVKYLIANP